MLGWSSAWYGAHLIPALRLLGCTSQLLRIVRTALASQLAVVAHSHLYCVLLLAEGWSPCAQCWVAIQFSRCRLTDPGRNCVRFTDLWCPPFILHPYYSLFCSENQVLFRLFLLFFLYSLFILHPYYSISFEKNQLFFADSTGFCCWKVHKFPSAFLSILPFYTVQQ